METEKQIWQQYSDAEKAAYLSAITGIATAGRQATEAELSFANRLGQQMGLPPSQLRSVESVASETTNASLPHCLDNLRQSDLKYALLADLMCYAKSDGQFTPDEKSRIRHIAAHLQVEQAQFSALNRFTDEPYGQLRGSTGSLDSSIDEASLSADTLQRMMAAVEPLLQGELGQTASGASSSAENEGAAIREVADNFGNASDNAGRIRGQASGGEPSGRAGSVMARFSGRNGYQGIGSAFDGLFGSSR